jgi:hypothetical protein
MQRFDEALRLVKCTRLRHDLQVALQWWQRLAGYSNIDMGLGLW